MQFSIRNLFFLSMVALMMTITSCSSSKSYADRKRSKYRSSRTHVVKAKPKTRKSRSKTISTPTTPSNAVALRSEILSNAKKYIGKKYVYGGKTPKGFDCSGFTAYVYKESGVNLSGPSRSQAREGIKIPRHALQRGDLIFFGKGKVSHVGIVADVGRDMLKVIHATSSRGVVLENIDGSQYWEGRYLFGRDILSPKYAGR